MIELHARCYYPSYGGYQTNDYPPWKFVKCLKGEAVNGYANVPDVGGYQRQIDANSRHVAFNVFGKWAAQELAQMGLGNPTLVPIPSSSHVDPNADFTAKRLCAAINAVAGNAYEVLPCLRQREAVKGSSKGGSRKFVDIRDNLACHGDLAGKTVVLIDDVSTSGNHLKACATILRQEGATVGHAICAAKTIWERPADMWAVPVENIDWDAAALGFEF